MFESATLTAAPASTRLWSTCAGVTGQILIVGCMLLAPLVSPAVLPNLRSYVTALEAPGPPPGPPPKAPTTVQPRPVKATHVYCPLCEPPGVPHEIAPVKDEPMPAVHSGPGVIGGDSSGVGTGGGVLLTGIIGGIPSPAPPKPIVERTPDPVKPAAAPIERVRAGGLVKLAAPVFHPDPVYPQIARTAHVEGVVVLEGIIGVDGRIHRLEAKSGHPFLVKAAIEAVSQWIYTPATLNGNLVEVIAPITITFRLAGR